MEFMRYPEMKKSVQIVIMAGLVIGFIALAAFLYPKLPAQIPMQWGLNGKVNYALPRQLVVSLMVLVDLGFGSYTVWLHRTADRIPMKDFMTSLVFPILFSIILGITQIRF
jgi:uncharacterized membrane protein